MKTRNEIHLNIPNFENFRHFFQKRKEAHGPLQQHPPLEHRQFQQQEVFHSPLWLHSETPQVV